MNGRCVPSCPAPGPAILIGRKQILRAAFRKELVYDSVNVYSATHIEQKATAFEFESSR
jgi:hypothetical protein